jgi:hypothetical protein
MATYDDTTKALVIAGVTILQDEHGRYRLNDFHHLSGARANKNPGEWLKNKSTQELISELVSQKGNSPFDVVTGGNAPGTYVHELLAVSYAGWISPAFQLKVNQAFIDMRRTMHTSLPATLDAYPELRALAEQSRTIIALVTSAAENRALAEHANKVAEIATRKATLALDNQEWMTIREYVYVNKLARQMPPSLCKRYGTYLTGYCIEQGIPVRSQGVVGQAWEKEHAYHVEIIGRTLSEWLCRYESQSSLKLIQTKDIEMS